MFTICLLIYVLALQPGCRDKYVSPYVSPPTGYLVVEGYISGNTITQFTLSRSITLPGDSAIPAESGANVQIEGSDNSTYPLTELVSGVYSSADTLTLNQAAQYRLRIHTGNGEDYLSDFAPFKTTPAIDSINWINGSSGVEIYANTHDPAANTRYYQWNWDQTYEYHSAENTYYVYDRDTIPPQIIPRTEQVYRCWMSASSENILVNTSAKLTQDVIYRMPVKNIPPNDIQLGVLYSILVRQYALTEDGYNFLSLMQNNTESLGSIFDAQPSQITGNIHCLTHPTERVIGYVSAGTVQQQRIFISRNQVPSTYTYSCPLRDTLFQNDPQDIQMNFASGGYTPEYLTDFGTAWAANRTGCLVCTARGGTNIIPSFWPN